MVLIICAHEYVGHWSPNNWGSWQYTISFNSRQKNNDVGKWRRMLPGQSMTPPGCTRAFSKVRLRRLESFVDRREHEISMLKKLRLKKWP